MDPFSRIVCGCQPFSPLLGPKSLCKPREFFGGVRGRGEKSASGRRIVWRLGDRVVPKGFRKGAAGSARVRNPGLPKCGKSIDAGEHWLPL